MKKAIQTTTAKKGHMKQTVVMLAVVLAVGIAAGMVGCQGSKARQEAVKEPVTLTVLFKTDLPGGKEETVFLAEVAPGASTPRHYHPGQEFAYVLEGSGILEEEGKPPVTVKPGLSINNFSSPEKAAYVHWATNTSKKDPQKWLVVLVTEKGYPLLIPVK